VLERRSVPELRFFEEKSPLCGLAATADDFLRKIAEGRRLT
jgi:hypothetical protein